MLAVQGNHTHLWLGGAYQLVTTHVNNILFIEVLCCPLAVSLNRVFSIFSQISILWGCFFTFSFQWVGSLPAIWSH